MIVSKIRSIFLKLRHRTKRLKMQKNVKGEKPFICEMDLKKQVCLSMPITQILKSLHQMEN